MRMLARVQDALELMFEYVAIALLAIMMVLVTADTAGRYLLHKPVFGTHEFVEAYLMVGVVFLGMARLQATGGQVAVDIVARHFPPSLRRVLLIVFSVIALVFLVLIASKAATQVEHSFVRQQVIATPFPFTTIPMPVWPSWFLLFAGIVMICLRLVTQTVLLLAGVPLPERSDSGH